MRRILKETSRRGRGWADHWGRCEHSGELQNHTDCGESDCATKLSEPEETSTYLLKRFLPIILHLRVKNHTISLIYHVVVQHLGENERASCKHKHIWNKAHHFSMRYRKCYENSSYSLLYLFCLAHTGRLIPLFITRWVSTISIIPFSEEKKKKGYLYKHIYNVEWCIFNPVLGGLWDVWRMLR